MIFIFDKIIVSIISIIGIAFIYWFFLMKKENAQEVSGSVDITVNGGYSPEVITIPLGKITKINFTRTDPTDCLSEIIIPDFKIKRALPLNKKVTIELKPDRAGEFIYHCSMNMYHGKIIIH